jgi:MFS family permease
MSQKPIIPPDHKMKIVYDFFERNKTIFTMIAIFGALAGFLYSLNKPPNENLVDGILFLVFLMGLLITLIVYDAMVTLFPLMKQNDEKFFTTFQIFFIVMFIILFLMFFFGLIGYLYSNYTDLVIWLAIAIFFYIVLTFGVWFNTFIRDKIGTSKKGLILIIAGYSIIVIWITMKVNSIFFGLMPHSLNFAEITPIAQNGFFFMILLIHSVSSVIYFIGTLIKRILFPEKPIMAEEVI